MPSLSVFGAQWGDEGKGKIIDRLAANADVVVRYQGGANAGHTVVVGGDKYVLHLVPSGVLHRGTLNVIGTGVAVDPVSLLGELDGLAERGVEVTPRELALSARAQVILDHHRRVDGLAERWRGAGRIGTTGRGIGPCYADKAARTGLRVVDLLDPERCRVMLRAALAEKNAVLTKVYGEPELPLEEEIDRFAALGERLAPFVVDAGAIVRDAYRDGRRVLFEGAQGILLDLDHGTYPFVTSSNTGVAGIAAGVGFPPRWLDRVIGIAKAYCTRVGEGPFPSEETGETGERIREAGNEFGATTGRPRRCGWLDAVALRYAMELNGADGWVVTNLDVLSGFDEIRAAVAYERDGERLDRFPANLPSLDGVGVVLESRPGWTEDLRGAREYGDLPPAARAYVEWLEELVDAPIVAISVGPDRDQVVPRGAGIDGGLFREKVQLRDG
jgi:adenylosuccinate synthase